MMTALNIAYAQPERRGFIRFNATALVLTVVVIVAGLIALALVAGLPAVLNGAGAPGPGRWIGLVVEWPLLIVFVMGIVALIYRYGPDRNEPKWKWASPGVIVATILWIVGSILFTVYVYHFGSYNKTYGSLSALLVLLIWMWLSAFAVLFGAEINGEAERQTRRDPTAGVPLPNGRLRTPTRLRADPRRRQVEAALHRRRERSRTISTITRSTSPRSEPVI